ncbi:PREDICTED: uncharacterized protein LOC108546444 [Eufriesea mexicana]|uniref:uncharacterized protein LOC108546444 n=1 Tax=Eufriesea mexicana TaxID=516756 RepID=UPI00083C3D9C|nr:PREDICTED: uncharacterized protein LOC108546444 [Eufriesea mexicana]
MEFLRILLFFCYFGFIFIQVSLTDHLEEKLKETEIEIAKLHFEEEPVVERKLYNVKWNQLWQVDLDKEPPFITNMYDKVLFIEANRFIVFPLDDSSSNRSVSRKIIPIFNSEPVKFVRSVVWRGILYLLICYETGSCSIYTEANNLQLRHRQTIQHNGCPLDAKFFIRANRLYLVVVDNFGQLPVPSLIYHWRGTYMDVITEVMTIAAVSVTTFNHKQSTIILFAQNNGNVPGIGSMVYEFKETSLDTIQFLETSKPISVHHYRNAGFNFILLIDEYGPSTLLWWDGHELLNWQQISQIRVPSLVHVVNINYDTIFFVGYNNILQLYKFENASDCTLINSMKLPSGISLIDMQTRIDKSTITMMLVIMNSDQVYSAILWELQIEEIPTEHSSKQSDILSKHLAELVEILRQRKPFVDEAEASWPFLLPAHEDLTISEPLTFQNLMLNSGTVENIHVFVDEDIIAPHELEKGLENLIHEIDSVLTSKEFSMLNNTNSLYGDIVVDGDAFIEQLWINRMDVDFFNDVDMHSNGSTDSNESQELPISLKGKDIVVNDLKVDAICGIPFQYWSLINDTSKMVINIGRDKIEFSNNTVHLNSNISLRNLNVRLLNGININELFNELFIINQNQRIKGNITYNDMLQIQNFTIQMLNGKAWNNYMNTITNQSFNNFIARKLQVENLYADSINSIPVSEAARVSVENVIKGETKIAKLHVTENLIIDSDFQLPVTPSHQIYFNVTMQGNLKIEILDLDKYSRILLNDKRIDLTNILDTYWTKSTDQVIENDVLFENSLTIDYLNTKYLNEFSEEEYLYTTATIIPENFKWLHFENIHIDDTFLVEGENDSFFEIAPESVTIRENFHLKHLHANQLFTNVFNSLLVTDILNGMQPYIFPRNMSVSTIKAKQIDIDELNFLFFNDKDNSSFLEKARNVNKHYEAKFTKTTEYHIENLNVEKINSFDIKKLMLLKDMKLYDLKNLVIYGDLTIKRDLKVDQIDGQQPITYIKDLAKGIVVFDTKMTFQKLTVQNATLKSLHNHDVNNLFENFFLKSRKQNISGKFSFYKITSDNIETNFINYQDTSMLLWIDKPLFLTGNVIFDDLFVEEGVITKTINNLDVNELYENLLDVSVSNITDLKVYGNISWDIPSMNSASLTSLFENAVTKASNQTIQGETIFQENVSASNIRGQYEQFDEIHDIILDTAIDDGNIEIIGEKVFEDDLDIDTLLVTGDNNISIINNIDILEFNSSVVRKDEEETITETITFLDDVMVDQIFVSNNTHNIPLNEVVLATDMLPVNVSFKDLAILQEVYLKNFDKINFDEFLKYRIAINREHEISADVQFHGIVEVTGNANLSRINDIYPSDLVLNGTEETQVISGSKIFEEDVIVNGNIHAPFINRINISSEYSNGIQNDEDVEIIGDLIFESKVKILGNVSVSNLTNGINLNTILYNLQEGTRQTLHTFAQNETEIEESIVRSSSISETLGNVFSYLEVEEKLKIQAPNIKKVDVVYYEQITKLNMFGEEPGSLCGLPENCSCPTEYMAELTKQGCYIRRTNGTKIVRNYHELYSTFGINVISNTISYSHECTSNNTENEIITISWIKSEMINTGDMLAKVRETPLEIRGFIKDAKIFMTDDNAAFVVLAIYYDTLHATHRTESVIYKINFESNSLSLHQKLFTDGAWAIEIFKTNHRDVYLLLGCFGNSEKSFLYKLDAVTSKFTIIRNFGGKTRNVKSLIQEQDCFILLDDFDTNAINIFYYNQKFDNFSNYQSLFHDARIHDLECFYINDFGQSDSFIVVTTGNDQFYVYEYMYAQKFQLRIQHQIDDLQTTVPFYHLENHYIFAGTSMNSTMLRIIKQGP